MVADQPDTIQPSGKGAPRVTERRGLLSASVAVFSMLALTGAALATLSEGLAQTDGAERISPDWLEVDKENRKVDLYIVAGLTTNNSGWNFNGYANGDLTITVPLDWLVEIRFTSRDGNFPHSVGIIEIEDEIPVSGDQAKVALPRAFSLQFSRGLFGPQEDKFDFKANRIGRFLLFCGVPVHAKGGMWGYFVVSDEISEPYVEVIKK